MIPDIKKIIISGGSGVVGSAIIDQFPSSVEEFIVLTRSEKMHGKQEGRVRYSAWNPGEAVFHRKDLQDADAIINLAGASVSKRWTTAHKEAILKSRLDSTNLLVRVAREHPGIKTFVSASAIGYYKPSFEVVSEDATPDSGFIGEVVSQWESCLTGLEDSHVRTVMLRIGLVLSPEGGFYAKMAPVFRNGLGARLGNGKQLMSWIHIDDLVGMFRHALNESEMSGAYNAVSPEVLDNKTFTKVMAASFGKKVWAPAVPAFALKLFMGEMASVALNSVGVAAKKIVGAGYDFRYPHLKDALASLASR